MKTRLALFIMILKIQWPTSNWWIQMQIIFNSFESGLIISLLERHSKNVPFFLLQQLHQSAHERCVHYARICTSAPLLPVIQRDPHLIEQETNLAMCTLWDRVNHWQIICKQKLSSLIQLTNFSKLTRLSWKVLFPSWMKVISKKREHACVNKGFCK